MADQKDNNTMVVCRMPSGLNTITTYADCVADGGTVVEKVIEPVPVAPINPDATAMYVYKTKQGQMIVGKGDDVLKDNGTIVAKLHSTWHVNRA